MLDMLAALRDVWAELGLPLEAGREHLPTYDYAGPATRSVHLQLSDAQIAAAVEAMGIKKGVAAAAGAMSADAAPSAQLPAGGSSGRRHAKAAAVAAALHTIPRTTQRAMAEAR